MAIGKITVGRETKYIVIEPSEQSEGFDADYQANLGEEQNKVVFALNQPKLSPEQIIAEAERNRQES